jgi:hypothetical protein
MAEYSRIPSGLFPSARTRPTYREPHPVRAGSVAIGAVAGVAWFLVFGLIDTSLRGYAYWTLIAGGVAWLTSAGLARSGDRGVAVGVAAAAGFAWSVAAIAVAVGWAARGDWPLW